jgi:glycosyltransferase 2 family protein
MVALRSTAARLLVTVAVLAFLASRIDMREAARAMLALDLRHGSAVLALVAVDRGVMVLRWLLLLRASQSPVSWRSAARIYLVSSFVGGFLPAGVGADAVRAYSLTRRTAEPGEAIASVTVDRLLGVLSLVLLGGLGVVLWARLVAPGLQQTVLALAVLIGLGAGGLFWADQALRAALPARWQLSPTGGRLLGLVDALGRYRDRRRALLTVLVLSVGVQLLRIWQAYLLGSGIGIDVGFPYYLVFMPIGLVLLLLPVSVSGFGLPQGAIVWLLQPQGVAEAPAFALSTLIVLTGILGNLPGAWLYLRAPAVEGLSRR